MRLSLILLAILVVLGCGAPQKKTETLPTPTSTATIVGSWKGSIVGTSFTGSITNSQFVINPSLTTGDVYVGFIPGCGTVEDAMDIQAVESNGTFTITTPNITVHGTITGEGTGTTISGTVAFKTPCFPDDPPLQGTYSMTRGY